MPLFCCPTTEEQLFGEFSSVGTFGDDLGVHVCACNYIPYVANTFKHLLVISLNVLFTDPVNC